MRVLTAERRQVILEQLAREGKLVAVELSSALRVSPDTVRRDLQELAEAGLLRRVHGGALPPAVGALPYAARRDQAPAAKAAIARETCRLLHSGQVIILDAGTTTLEVARHLPQDLRATIITNSPPIAVALAEHPTVEVTMLGGRLEKDARATVGAATIDEGLKSIRMGGRIVTCGSTSGPKVTVLWPRLFFRHADILGSTMGNASEFEEVLGLLDKGVRPVVDSVYPLAEVSEALRHLDAGEQFGKVVLKVSD